MVSILDDFNKKFIKGRDIPTYYAISDYVISRIDNSMLLESIMEIFSGSDDQYVLPLGFSYYYKWFFFESILTENEINRINFDEDIDPNKVYHIHTDYFVYGVNFVEKSFTSLNNPTLDKILVLESLHDLLKFSKIYSTPSSNSWVTINWKSVYQDFGGIQISNVHNDYINKNPDVWWWAWYVPSGFVWNKDILSTITRII